MNVSANNEWHSEFGIVADGAEMFFASKSDLNARSTDVSQSHILRRAFDLLKLDGVLCTENTPLVYFKELKRIDAAAVAELHKAFWNHGGAPILVLIAPNEVHIYSGFTRPEPQTDPAAKAPGLVEILDRASAALRQFLPAVQSGEFFRRHAKSFNPAHRVDRELLDNLQATREQLIEASGDASETIHMVSDALLCRLVFACYLFDRGVVGETYLQNIGLQGASHLRDVLGYGGPEARKALYDLFRRLGQDFNGDLFSDNLNAEEELVSASHIGPLEQFFRATDVRSGQLSFWPYDFGLIPIEVISAIYERFLKSDKGEGAFYTPRFLAELVLDVALADTPSLLGQRYLDPACGSGIFLVGIFNRLAEEWKRQNPEARNDRRARELRKVLCNSLYGIDINPTACRITAFSLYLAYLDQLTPRDIQELHEKGHRLPTLVHYPGTVRADEVEGNIWCGDFFADQAGYLADADLVIGNPPWGSTAVRGTPAAAWCTRHKYPIPDKQIATSFVWKAAHHVRDDGRICLVLPHGTLFNLSATALNFQRSLFQLHAVDHVLNLADYQRFLFEEAGHPAMVVSYKKGPPESPQHEIQYWAPKTDWLVTRAEVIAIAPEDRSTLTVGEVLRDLQGEDAPQIWKQRYWATPRDWRLIDRLSLYPRLRNHVRRAKDKGTNKPWLMAVGFQPVTENDDPAKAKLLRLGSRLFIEATSPRLDLFLLPGDCSELPSNEFAARRTANPLVFRAPHVLVPKGFTSTAFADFDVAFQDAIRAISGPKEDRDLLIFLAAYLRSPLARYFLFHTSSNWGVSRQQVHVEELIRLPFPLPGMVSDPERAWQIVREVSQIVTAAAEHAGQDFVDRNEVVRLAERAIEPLVNEYFDVVPTEKVLIDDTVNVTIPSVRPTRRRRGIIPTIEPSKPPQRERYVNRLCEILNGWSKSGSYHVQGDFAASAKLGIGVAVLQKGGRDEAFEPLGDSIADLLPALQRIQNVTPQRLNTFELIRGAKVFDKNRLYIVKPIGHRFWTETAALNDADEIAGTILMHTPQRVAWQ